MTGIIIADDHSIVRHGLKRILSCNEEFFVVGEAESIPQLKTVLSSRPCADVLILDLSMPGGVAIEMIKDIKNNYPNLRVLILSLHREDQYGLHAFKAGAMGYLSKECASEQLLDALREILKGKHYFAQSTWDLISNELESKDSYVYAHHELSNREFYVLKMLGQGKTLTEISDQLSISIKTVSTYRNRLLKKMKMTTNAEVVKYVFTHGLSIEI